VAARGLVFRRDRQIREVDSEGKSHRGAEVVAGEGDRLVGEVVESDPGHGAWGRGREECRRREAVVGVDVLLVEGIVGARVREVGEGFLEPPRRPLVLRVRHVFFMYESTILKSVDFSPVRFRHDASLRKVVLILIRLG